MALTNEIFRKELKRLMRQLNQRAEAVKRGQRKDSYYQNKRREFIELIRQARMTNWFSMPKRGTRISNIYYDEWN